MIAYLIGGVVGFVASLAFVYFPILANANALILGLGKFMYISGMDIDDDEMQSKLNKHFFVIFASLVKMIFWIVLFIAVAVGVAWGLFYLLVDADGSLLAFEQYIVTVDFLVGSLLGMVPAFLLIKFVLKTSNNNDTETYSQFSKFLHYVFLGNSFIAKLLFGIWQKRYKGGKGVTDVAKGELSAVYVSGLARAGTTVLMQSLGTDARFSSLSYKDLPLLFLPTKTDKEAASSKAVERAHGDGVMHSLDSYEALEEPFWKNFQPNYVTSKTLVTQSIEPRVYSKYTYFRNWYADGKVYLCKNNNHLLRAESLHQLDKGAGVVSKTIIPFRDPLTHAQSLLHQHKHLSAMQLDDEFVLDYMDMLVHNEFGLGRKQSVFSKDSDTINGDWNELDTWLQYWYSYYTEVLAKYKDSSDVAFVQYEQFCSHPVATMSAVYSFLGVDEVETLAKEPYKPSKAIAHSVDPKMTALYEQMSAIAINR